MNEHVNLEWLWTVLGVAGTLGVRKIMDKRKVVAENRQEEAKAKEQEVDADTKAVDLFERYASQMTPRVEALQASYDKIFDLYQDLRVVNSNVLLDNQILKRDNEILKQENHQLKQDNNALRLENKYLSDKFDKSVKGIKGEIQSVKTQMKMANGQTFNDKAK